MLGSLVCACGGAGGGIKTARVESVEYSPARLLPVVKDSRTFSLFNDSSHQARSPVSFEFHANVPDVKVLV